MSTQFSRRLRRLMCWSRALSILLVVEGLGLSASGVESWPQALARMPLNTAARQLNRTNCVDVMLRAFTSNQVVKGLIFMPGATDEFYMFRRAKADLQPTSPSLLDAVTALTNQSLIRVAFHPPLLLLHTEEDQLQPEIAVQDPATAEKLRRLELTWSFKCNDWDWDRLQPKLREGIRMDLRPWKGSADSWHFYRHSFAAWGLTGWEALECAALAGKSKFAVTRHRVRFEVDGRIQPHH